MLELGLRFPDPATVVVSLNEDGEIEEAASQPFAGPLDAAAQKELHWYLEVYPVQYMTEVDDDRAERIAAQAARLGCGAVRGGICAHATPNGCSIAFRIMPSRAGCSPSAPRILRSWPSRGSC